MERAVAWIFRTYDANLFFIRSLSSKCLFTFFGDSFVWYSKNITILEELKKEWRNRLFWKKPLSSFQNHLQQRWKMEGAKYPGESRVACLICLSYPLHSICVGLNAILAVVILQMHCQMKLRRSPCLVFPCFNPEIATIFWVEIAFFLWVPWFIVRLQRFWRASSIPLFLHLSKSFRVMTFSTCSLSLYWLKSERIFFWLPEQSFVFAEFFDFFASYFLGYFWKENLPHEGVRFFSDDCQLRSRQHWHFCSRLNLVLFFHKIVAFCRRMWLEQNSHNDQNLGFFSEN